MLSLHIDRTVSVALGDQVADQLERLIHGRLLRPGARLPASRRLAESLGVSRNTVVAAYQRLESGGWVESGVGRGTFVADQPPSISAEVDAAAIDPPFTWEGSIAHECPPPTGAGSYAPRGPDGGEPVDFAGAVPGAETYPAEAIRRVSRQVLDREGRQALVYGSPAGYRPLRAFLAHRASQEGAPVGPQDILIVGGSQQGLDLIARLLLEPGDTVVVEAPTYSNALRLWRLHGARVVGVPMDDQGIQPRPLEAILTRTHPKFLYLMPTFQNPTGLTMDEARRREVVEVARAARVPLVEDHFNSELRFSGDPLPPLRAFDDSGQVLQLGTFSKILCPGFRVGWIIAPPPIRQRLLDLKRTCDLATSLPAQMVVAELCVQGELDHHLHLARCEHARRLEAMVDAIDRGFPPGSEVTRPRGGMTLWLGLPAPASAQSLHQAARARGVLVAPGDWFFPDGGGDRHIRLSFVGEPVERIEKGIAILGQLLGEQLRRRPGIDTEEVGPFV